MPRVDRSRAFEQVAEHYRAMVRTGELRPGDELPAVRPMAESWGIGTKTAREALAMLRDEGWIASRPGKPAVVRDDHP